MTYNNKIINIKPISVREFPIPPSTRIRPLHDALTAFCKRGTHHNAIKDRLNSLAFRLEDLVMYSKNIEAWKIEIAIDTIRSLRIKSYAPKSDVEVLISIIENNLQGDRRTKDIYLNMVYELELGSKSVRDTIFQDYVASSFEDLGRELILNSVDEIQSLISKGVMVVSLSAKEYKAYKTIGVKDKDILTFAKLKMVHVTTDLYIPHFGMRADKVLDRITSMSMSPINIYTTNRKSLKGTICDYRYNTAETFLNHIDSYMGPLNTNKTPLDKYLRDSKSTDFILGINPVIEFFKEWLQD